MEAKYQNALIFLVVLLLGGSVFLFTTGMFSIVDGENSIASCDVPIGGGSCSLLLELPEDTALSSGYSFDINVQSVADSEFSDELELYPFVSGGPYYEECSSNYFCNENTYIDLYKFPSSNYVNPYQIKLRTTASANGRVTNDDGRLYMYLYGGYVSVSYPYSDVYVCEFQDYDLCLARNFIAREYVFDGRPIFSTGYISSVGYDDLYARGSLGSVSESLVAEGVVAGSNLPDENIVFYVERKIKEKYSTAYTKTFGNPTMYSSYKQEHFITNLDLLIGGDSAVKYPGVSEGRIYLPDISKEINDYCGRTGVSPRGDECLIKLEFESNDGGKISIVSELGELNPIGGDFSFGSITGLVSFDFSEEPVQAGVTSLIILLILVALLLVVAKVMKK